MADYFASQSGELTLMDTDDGGIVVENGSCSFTIGLNTEVSTGPSPSSGNNNNILPHSNSFSTPVQQRHAQFTRPQQGALQQESTGTVYLGPGRGGQMMKSYVGAGVAGQPLMQVVRSPMPHQQMPSSGIIYVANTQGTLMQNTQYTNQAGQIVKLVQAPTIQQQQMGMVLQEQSSPHMTQRYLMASNVMPNTTHPLVSQHQLQLNQSHHISPQQLVLYSTSAGTVVGNGQQQIKLPVRTIVNSPQTMGMRPAQNLLSNPPLRSPQQLSVARQWTPKPQNRMQYQDVFQQQVEQSTIPRGRGSMTTRRARSSPGSRVGRGSKYTERMYNVGPENVMANATVPSPGSHGQEMQVVSVMEVVNQHPCTSVSDSMQQQVSSSTSRSNEDTTIVTSAVGDSGSPSKKITINDYRHRQLISGNTNDQSANCAATNAGSVISPGYVLVKLPDGKKQLHVLPPAKTEAKTPGIPTRPLSCTKPGTNYTVSTKHVDNQTIGEAHDVVNALCGHCGNLSVNLTKCDQCNHKLPPSVRFFHEPGISNAVVPILGHNRAMGKITVPPPLIRHENFYGSPKPRDVKTPKGRVTVTVREAIPGRGRGRGRGRPRLHEEPEILTLSSDDEGESDKGTSAEGPSCPISSGAVDQAGAQIPGILETIVSQKEPVILPSNEEDEEDLQKGPEIRGGGQADFGSLEDATLKGPYSSLHCRLIRIGSYKTFPKERAIFLPQGIRLLILPVNASGEEDEEAEPVQVDIPVNDVVKMLACFGKETPVIYLYVTARRSALIREVLRMTDKVIVYFDSTSNADECHKRITLMPERVDEDARNLIREMYAGVHTHDFRENILAASSREGDNGVLVEINQMEANEILIRSTPKPIQKILESISETKLMLLYPPPPQRGGISVFTDDYRCLESEEFLNDVIIDFFLKWLLHDKLSGELQARTHAFSTFFYKRLTSKPKKGKKPHPMEDDPSMTPAEKRHARVKTWTKSVDIFTKDFIIVPINEHAHWFLAIICFPGLDGPVRMSDGQPVIVAKPAESPLRKSTRIRIRLDMPINVDDGEWSDRDEADGDEDEMEETDDGVDESSGASSAKKSKVEEEPEPLVKSPTETYAVNGIKQPCILIFDSLAGASRARIVATLRDYLTVEHRVRRGIDHPFTRESMKGASPRVPQQMNFSDCGIFTLQYAENFFQAPIMDYTLPIRSLTGWFTQAEVSSKRQEVAALIRKLMMQHNPDHASISVPELNFFPPPPPPTEGGEGGSKVGTPSKSTLKPPPGKPSVGGVTIACPSLGVKIPPKGILKKGVVSEVSKSNLLKQTVGDAVKTLGQKMEVPPCLAEGDNLTKKFPSNGVFSNQALPLAAIKLSKAKDVPVMEQTIQKSGSVLMINGGSAALEMLSDSYGDEDSNEEIFSHGKESLGEICHADLVVGMPFPADLDGEVLNAECQVPPRGTICIGSKLKKRSMTAVNYDPLPAMGEGVTPKAALVVPATVVLNRGIASNGPVSQVDKVSQKVRTLDIIPMLNGKPTHVNLLAEPTSVPAKRLCYNCPDTCVCRSVLQPRGIVSMEQCHYPNLIATVDSPTKASDAFTKLKESMATLISHANGVSESVLCDRETCEPSNMNTEVNADGIDDIVIAEPCNDESCSVVTSNEIKCINESSSVPATTAIRAVHNLPLQAPLFSSSISTQDPPSTPLLQIAVISTDSQMSQVSNNDCQSTTLTKVFGIPPEVEILEEDSQRQSLLSTSPSPNNKYGRGCSTHIEPSHVGNSALAFLDGSSSRSGRQITTNKRFLDGFDSESGSSPGHQNKYRKRGGGGGGTKFNKHVF